MQRAVPPFLAVLSTSSSSFGIHGIPSTTRGQSVSPFSAAPREATGNSQVEGMLRPRS